MSTSSFPIQIFIEWIEKNYQLYFDAHNQIRLIKIIEKRCQKLSLNSFYCYFTLLQKDKGESEWFLSEITIGESSFFRYPKLFVFLEKIVLPNLLKKQRKINILHIGCSCGEESYSMAILLDRLGIPNTQFEIVAIDIDTFKINKARQGIYRLHSLMQVTPSVLQTYFRKINENLWQCSPNICKQVQFHTQNVFQLEKTALLKNYDLIFCMNVMIYFSPTTIKHFLKILLQISANSTKIFISPTDIILQMRNDFELYREKEVIWYQKKIVNATNVHQKIDVNNCFSEILIPKPMQSKKSTLYQEGQEAYAKKNFSAALKIFFEGIEKVPPCALCYFGIAQIYADQENTLLAIQYLEHSLKIDSTYYAAFLLMGILYLQINDLQNSRKYFRKTLEINPNCQEAEQFLEVM